MFIFLYRHLMLSNLLLGLVVHLSFIPHVTTILLASNLLFFILILYYLYWINQDANTNFEPVLSGQIIIIICICCAYVFYSIFNTSLAGGYLALSLPINIIVLVLSLRIIPNFITMLVRSYVAIVFLMSSLFLVIMAGVYLELISLDNWMVNLYEISNGAIVRDNGIASSYSFPFYSTLYLTGSNRYTFFSSDLLLISGWAHEPTTGALLAFPALLILLKNDLAGYRYDSKRRLIYGVIIFIFWVRLFSFASFAAAIIISLLVANNLKELVVKNITLIAFFILFLILAVPDFVASKSYGSQTFMTALRELSWFFNIDDGTSYELALRRLVAWFVIILHATLILYYFSFRYHSSFLLINIYILVHSMKGAQVIFYFLPFVLMWMIFLLFSERDSKNPELEME